MTVLAMPRHGRWAWDDRGDGRAVRVSTHADAGLLAVSLWRDDLCVGTVRPAPVEAAALATALTDGLAELADRPAPAPPAAPARLPGGEGGPPGLGAPRPPAWCRSPAAVAAWAARAPR